VARERAEVIDEGRCPPTAWALPLEKGLRHVPVGSSAIKLPQSRGDAKGRNVAFWQMLSKKGFCGGLRATLIQDQKSMRNLDSKIRLPGFVRFIF
jgi:hypothetical protein